MHVKNRLGVQGGFLLLKPTFAAALGLLQGVEGARKSTSVRRNGS